MTFKVIPSSLAQTSARDFVNQLIRANLIKSGFRQVLAGKDLGEIEHYLISKNLVNQEELAEQYAEFFKLPFIHLTNRPIDPAVAQMLPVSVAEQYKIVAYDVKGRDFYLAVGRPSKLQSDAPRAVLAIRQQKGLHVHLAIAPEAEVTAVIHKLVETDLAKIKQATPAPPKHENKDTEKSEPVPEPPKAESVAPKTELPPHVAKVELPEPPAVPVHKPIFEQDKPEVAKEAVVAKPEEKPEPTIKPVTAELPSDQSVRSLNKKDLIQEVEPRNKHVDLRRLEIPKEVLQKIPYDVAKKYQIIVFGSEKPKSSFEPPQIKVALVNPDDQHVKEILSYIEHRNKVLIDRYATDQESFDTALKFYKHQSPADKLAAAESKRTQSLPVAEPPKSPATEPTKNEITQSLPALDKQEPLAVKLPEEPVVSVPPPSEPPRPVVEERAIPSVAEKNTALPPRQVTADKVITIAESEIVNRPSDDSAVEVQRLNNTQENNLEDQNLDKLLVEPVLSVEELAKVFRKGVIPEIVAAMLFLAIRMKASDIHLEAEKTSDRIRYRIDGLLHDILRVPTFLHAPLTSRIKILSKMKIDEQRVPQDGRFDVILDKRQVDLRVSTMPTVHGEKIVMRLLDKSEGIKSLEQLGVTGSNFDTLIENINKPYGIILSTGPTGSGKSTTLYAILTRISKPGVNIVTLEDPVEYELPGINQAQVKPQIGFTFAEGLRSVLRQDPNVIMVGEIRDLETAAMATHSALTGHLVLSTLHTNDAAGALPRLINMGVEPFLITSSINAVIGQRLVRRVCDNCREKVEIPPAVKGFVQKQLAAIPSGQLKEVDLEKMVFYHGKGCAQCTNGYQGRIGIFEVLPMTAKIEDLAVAKDTANEIKREAVKEGMITMMQDGLMKALKGITTVDEVMRVTTASIKESPGV